MNKIKPQKRLGQNFLRDKNIARKIAAQIDAPPPRWIIEIGPGQGILTEFLIPIADKYLGIEIDPALVEILRKRFGQRQEVEIWKADFLQVDLPGIVREASAHSIVIAGNIPYNITSPILFRLFEAADFLHQAVLMVQKEVGQRLVAQPGTREYGLLSINAQLFAEVEYLFTVPSKVFFPRPEVDSAVIKLTFKKQVYSRFRDFNFFNKILRHCFQHRRKMLRKSLSMLFPTEVLNKLSQDLTKRPEQLSIPEWIELIDAIFKLTQKE